MPECPVGCGRPCAPGKVMCYACWRRVPIPLQAALYRAVEKREYQPDLTSEIVYERALDAAIRAVVVALGLEVVDDVEPA